MSVSRRRLIILVNEEWPISADSGSSVLGEDEIDDAVTFFKSIGLSSKKKKKKGRLPDDQPPEDDQDPEDDKTDDSEEGPVDPKATKPVKKSLTKPEPEPEPDQNSDPSAKKTEPGVRPDTERDKNLKPKSVDDYGQPDVKVDNKFKKERGISNDSGKGPNVDTRLKSITPQIDRSPPKIKPRSAAKKLSDMQSAAVDRRERLRVLARAGVDYLSRSKLRTNARFY